MHRPRRRLVEVAVACHHRSGIGLHQALEPIARGAFHCAWSLQRARVPTIVVAGEAQQTTRQTACRYIIDLPAQTPILSQLGRRKTLGYRLSGQRLDRHSQHIIQMRVANGHPT